MDVTAFASVLLVLVFAFIFVLSRPVRTVAGYVGVEVPRVHRVADQRGSLREDALLVAIQRDGKIWLRDDQINSGELSNALREGVRHGAPRKVYLRVDRRADFGNVNRVLEAIHIAGIEDIAFEAHEADASPK